MDDTESNTTTPSRNTAVNTLEGRVRELHVALFPEEYDHIHDSFSEAKARMRGENPMGAEYVARRNAYRGELSFESFGVGPDARNDDTYDWISEKVRVGRENELLQIIERRAGEVSQNESRRERSQTHEHDSPWLDQMSDNMLAGTKFIDRGQDKSDSRIIAFRIMGLLFELNLSDGRKSKFFQQIKRVLPNLSETEYQNLCNHAMREWLTAYGY